MADLLPDPGGTWTYDEFFEAMEAVSDPPNNYGITLWANTIHEVIECSRGTKNEETLDVLKSIRKSLQKDYPFVDIVDPLSTNFAKIASFAESKMKQLDSKIIASRSRLLSKHVGPIIKTQHMKMLGSYEEVYPIERTSTGTLFGRTHNYKKAFIQEVVPTGKKIRVKITGAHQRRLDCKILDPQMS